MPEYVVGVDVWEGALDIDEGVLKAAGVQFIIPRMNDINGGHHLDENFLNQWEQADPFIHWPYFVYNPWINGSINFQFLSDNMPRNVQAVSADIEVRYTGITPDEYARQVKIFLSYVQQYWRVRVYTGGWFLNYLSSWPTNVEYWWARYPYAFYPLFKTTTTWESLMGRLQAATWAPGNNIPGPCRLWQITADRYILPGTAGRPIDINLFNGTAEELRAWAGNTVTPPPVLTLEERVGRLEKAVFG